MVKLDFIVDAPESKYDPGDIKIFEQALKKGFLKGEYKVLSWKLMVSLRIDGTKEIIVPARSLNKLADQWMEEQKND